MIVKKLAFLALSVLLFMSDVQCGKSKYSKEANKKATLNPADEQHTFRSRKATMIWKKAQTTLQGEQSRLDSLFDELMGIDKELMELKKMKFEDMDPYGEAENHLEDRIQELLKSYGMAGRMNHSEKLSNKVEDHVKDQEKHLESIYSKAQELGFSEEELKYLKTEISHHKRTMAELDALVGSLKDMEESMRVESNAVDKKFAKDVVDPQKMKELRLAIKEKNKELSAGRSRLDLLSDSPAITKNVSFTHIKVLKLWSDILKSNFTEEERESLKVELMHLEKKLNKRDRMNEELSLVEKHHQGLPSTDKSRKHLVEKTSKMKEKHEELNKHVDKYEKTLKSRISDRYPHSEL